MLNATCDDLDRALESENAELLEAVKRHAADCRECRERLEIWSDISSAAPDLRRTWESPGLRERIAAAISGERSSRVLPGWPGVFRLPALRPIVLLRAAVILLVAAPLVVLLMRTLPPDKPAANAGDAFLTGRTLEEVESAETAYVQSIERLSRLAEPRIENPKSQLFLNYREKIRILDQAIAECRAGVDGNPMNAHLRRELLAMYQEKTRTLEGLIGEGDSNVR